ncbi:Polygalacturonase [Quillaja saponaria]|uniref:Polygalacturonase n=1 Tax=Quillaja saponaria TaxID=32244 RepID=A0AAD7LP70_QUISA|nr:Polygalacturonase [Quillaja saponaria]
MAPVLNLSLSFLFFVFHSALAAPAVTYNVANFGAKPDGKTESTKAFLNAWANACGSTRPASIYVPRGRFLLRNAAFTGPCKNNAISVQIDGTLVAPSDYRVIGKTANWLLFQRVNGVSIEVGSLMDEAPVCGLVRCQARIAQVEPRGLTSLNSQMFHIVVNGCRDVKMQGIKVIAAGNSPNTDGIHVQLSTGVTILKSKIRTGDDCVSIGPGTTNLWIENVACGPGHGISIGSLGKDMQEQGVQNVTVKTITFTNTQNGLRIKSWGRASNEFAKNILFQHAVMFNVQNPIVIDQNYCPSNKGCPGQVSGVKVSNVIYQDVHGSSATQVAVKFDCSPKFPCSGIRLENVKLTYKNLARFM